MKKIKLSFFIIVILTTIVLVLNIAIKTQNNENVIGNYRENGASYFIQKDSTFIIVAYATLITGKWNITNNNRLTLIPKNPEAPFILYGYHNPFIVGTKIMFSGFYKDNDETLVGLNNFNSMQRVFNENVNCTSFPYVHLFSEKVNKISFSCSSENNKKNESKVYTYIIDNDFNDFVAYYFSSSEFRKPIILKIKKEGLENSFEEKLQKIKELNEEDKKMIEQINLVTKKKGMFDFQYYNSSYNCILRNEFNIDEYIFIKSKNAFLLKKTQISDDAYHNLNLIFKYKRIGNMQVMNKKISINKKTLFHVECDTVKEDTVRIR